MTYSTQLNTDDSANTVFQSFTDKRQNPTLFLLLDEPLNWTHAWSIRNLLKGKKIKHLDVVIRSGGGDIHVAYVIVQLLRSHAEIISACVPFYATSAATLICIGADEIILDELAYLGPLDPQYNKRGNDSIEKHQTSSLDLFQSLGALKKFSTESFEEVVRRLLLADILSPDRCVEQAAKFSHGITDALFTKLSPEVFGEHERHLEMSARYAMQILRRCGKWTSDEKIVSLAQQLVYGYPSHGYIIDFQELKNIGLESQVKLFTHSESDVVEALIPYPGSPVQYLEPQDYKQEMGFVLAEDPNGCSDAALTPEMQSA